MKRTLFAVAALLAGFAVSVSAPAAFAEDAKPAATDADRAAKVEAMKLAAKQKFAEAKALIAEKAKEASEAAKSAYEKAKAEYDKAQTPEAKADRSAKIDAAKLAAAEKWAKAKAYIAEKAQKIAEASKAEYEKLKAAATAPK